MTNRAEFFYGDSGDYYLSIGVEKSKFWALFAIFDILGPDGAGRGPTDTPRSLRPQNPTKKLTHWVDLLGQL